MAKKRSIKIIPQNKFEGLKADKVCSFTGTNLSAVVGREYIAINAGNKDEKITVCCSQNHPYILKEIDPKTSKYLR